MVVVRSILLAVIGSMWAGYAFSYDASWPSQKDMLGLPEYCKPLPFMGGRGGNYATQMPEWQKWEPMLGETYKHTHHYCNGLNFIRRADRAIGNSNDVRLLLKLATNEFSYVIERAPESFMLLPEMLTQRARVYLRLNEIGKAIMDFNAAIKVGPTYAPAYAGLIDLYVDLKNIKEAKKVYEAGIKEIADSKALARRAAMFEKK